MAKYIVGGMNCAACSARVEKAVGEIEGVENCSVNLLSGVMTVCGNVNDETVIKAVVKAGYSAKKYSVEENRKKETVNETATLIKRLLFSLIFLLPLMYVSMGHNMFDFPLPGILTENSVLAGSCQMVLCILVMLINKKFFISGFKAVLNKAPNMDTLVAMGSGASFIYSVYVLLMMHGEVNGHHLYFESAAMILVLITVGKSLESYSKGKTTSALNGLMEMAPETALIEADGKEIEVPVKNVKKGDIFILRPGSRIPVDGEVISGSSAVDEAALTGESIPSEKAEGDKVSAGCINLTGYLKCKAVSVGEDTTLSQIIKLVSDASAEKAPVSKVADRVSGIFVPVVLVIAVITFFSWLIIGENTEFSLTRAIAVLVISCPCALGLATPVAIMVGSGKGAKCGILFKSAAALENTGKTDIVALDKTGTVTKGEPCVREIFGDDKDKLLKVAYSLEIKSEHPLGRAVTKYGEENNVTPYFTEKFEIKPGGGISADIDGKICCGGNLRFVSEVAEIPDKYKEKAQKMADEGCTPLFFSELDSFLGIISVSDTIKDDSAKAVSDLKKAGMRVVMITGDNEKTAQAIGKAVGVDTVFSEVLPSGKEAIIKELKKEGRVLMVGDGINDAPALTRADIGVAIGNGQDIAIDAADIVLMKSTLSDAIRAILLSRATLRNIHENLFWAFIYNIIGIPLAAGVFIKTFGWEMSPMFGAAAMSVSSFCVVMNALRLNFADITNPGKYKRKRKVKERKEMKVTLKIDGMMCPHCEARVKSVLEAVDGVEEVIASHENKSAEITLSKEVDIKLLENIVTEQGYKIID